MQQKLQLQLKQDTITGFSYSFTACLLAKLKELKETKTLFVDDTGEYEDEKDVSLTEIALPVIAYLQEQLDFHLDIHYSSNINTINTMIKLIEEFLAIFETTTDWHYT